MNLVTRPAISEQWRESTGQVMDAFLNCMIELYDQEQAEDGSDYNWKTNEGGTADSVLLWSGAAQLQVFRFTLTMDAPVGSVDQIRSVRFTVDANDPGIVDLDIRRGQSIRVIECPMNTTLLRYQYVVNSGLNSGSNMRRTIETEVDMTRVIP